MNAGNSFRENLEIGQLGESVIARWLMSRGSSVLPVYEKEIGSGKGPRFFTPKGKFAAPDMFVIPQMRWVEAKHKSVFTWYRKKGSWQTGIDLHHYRDYIATQDISKLAVWLLFLHKSARPDPRDLQWGCPRICPTGLFGRSLKELQKCVDHEDRYIRNGRTIPMVYWNESDLKRIATLEELSGFFIDDDGEIDVGLIPNEQGSFFDWREPVCEEGE